ATPVVSTGHGGGTPLPPPEDRTLAAQPIAVLGDLSRETKPRVGIERRCIGRRPAPPRSPPPPAPSPPQSHPRPLAGAADRGATKRIGKCRSGQASQTPTVRAVFPCVVFDSRQNGTLADQSRPTQLGRLQHRIHSGARSYVHVQDPRIDRQRGDLGAAHIVVLTQMTKGKTLDFAW